MRNIQKHNNKIASIYITLLAKYVLNACVNFKPYNPMREVLLLSSPFWR